MVDFGNARKYNNLTLDTLVLKFLQRLYGFSHVKSELSQEGNKIISKTLDLTVDGTLSSTCGGNRAPQ